MAPFDFPDARQLGGRGGRDPCRGRRSADHTQSALQCSAAATCSATPIDLGASTDTTVVVFFGTGLRKAALPANVRATIGGVDAPVLFAGAQGEFVGLDQINVQLPQSLRGRGEGSVVFTVDGSRRTRRRSTCADRRRRARACRAHR